MFIEKSKLEERRREFPAGTRLELVRMDDPFPPPIGTRGTVTGVDDAGHIEMRWDNGSSLSVVLPVDEIRKLEAVTVICYGKETTYEDRSDAIAFFTECLCSSEGAESERYLEILIDLKSGKVVCSDKK